MNMPVTVLFASLALIANAAAARPTVFLSDRTYAAPGVECNVYFKNVTDAIVPERYAWHVRCERGRHENVRWTFLAKEEDAGVSFPLVLEMWADEHGLAAAATTTVSVAACPADRTRKWTVALFGDSLTGCRFQDQTSRLMREFGFSGFATVGSCKGEVARHDGYGGFTWESFMSRYALALDEIDNLQSEAERAQLRKFGEKIPEGEEWRRGLLKSPLVRLVGGEKVVDVQMWLDKVNGGRAPDVLVIELGTNDVFGDEECNRLERLENLRIPAAKRLLKVLRAAMPDTEIAVMTIPPGADADAFGENYGCEQSDFVFRRNVVAYNRALADMVRESGDDRLALVPAHAAVDTVYGSIREKSFAHARTERKIERCVNAVHFDLTGARQYGDALYAWLVGHYIRTKEGNERVNRH